MTGLDLASASLGGLVSANLVGSPTLPTGYSITTTDGVSTTSGPEIGTGT